MEEIYLKKNKLDKEFDFESKKAMGWFTLGTITFVGFLATMILQGEIIIGSVFGFLILVCAIFFFNRKQKSINLILEKIENLSRNVKTMEKN